MDLTGGDVDDLDRTLVRVAGIGARDSSERDGLSVRGPGEGRRDQARGGAPQPGRKAARLSTFNRSEPDVRRPRCLGSEVIIVTHFEGVIVAFGPALSLRLVHRLEGDLPTVGTPRELPHTGRSTGDLLRVAAVGPHHEHLNLCVLARAGEIEEGELAVRGRPPRLGDSSPLVGEDALRSGHDVDEDELALVAVVVVVRPGHHHHNGPAVRRDLRIVEPCELREIGEFESPRLT